jgi:predicted metal-dependent hydrolase
VLPEEVRAGVRHFNARAFFEAHEAWEDHWGHGPPPERAATLGLIKAAVALHHLEAGNAAGFSWQAEEAIRHLRENAGVWPELRLAELADALGSLAAQARFHGIARGFELPTLPDL